MCKYIIDGGKRLNGEIEIEGSKNAILPILAAAIINRDVSVIHNCPALRDVLLMIEIMRELGCKVDFDGETAVIDSSCMNSYEISRKNALEMRSSIIFLGPVLSRMGKITISHPGGCELGPRPVDLHLKALRMLGAEIYDICNGLIYAKADNLKGCEIQLDYPSVGATENIMIAAVLSEGETVIRNAAKEPEIVDLQNFLNAMGAEIKGAGSGIIYINGNGRDKNSLHDVEYTVIPDRIVAGTYMAAAAITGGDVVLKNVITDHIAPVISALKESGTQFFTYDDSIRVKGPEKLAAIEIIRTLPYPGFPTDMQAQLVSVMSVADGTGIMIETVFESRYKHVDELVKMGANIKVDGRIAVIRGVKALKGADVTARDLRGGAALIVAGLKAEGCTIVNDSKHIERGYVNIEKKLASVGANIVKMQ